MKRSFLTGVPARLPISQVYIIMDPDDLPLKATTISHPCEPDYPTSPLSIPWQKLIEDVCLSSTFQTSSRAMAPLFDDYALSNNPSKTAGQLPVFPHSLNHHILNGRKQSTAFCPTDKRHRILFPHDPEKSAPVRNVYCASTLFS